jgi:hypothetical protein
MCHAWGLVKEEQDSQATGKGKVLAIKENFMIPGG